MTTSSSKPSFLEMLRSIGRDAANTGVRKWVHVPITIEESVGPSPIYAPEMCEYDMRLTFARRIFCQPKHISDMARLMRKEVAHYCFDGIKQELNRLEMLIVGGGDMHTIRNQLCNVRKEMDV